MTPVDDFRTRVYAIVSFRTRIPHFLIRPFVKPLALRVFKQDAFAIETVVGPLFGLGNGNSVNFPSVSSIAERDVRTSRLANNMLSAISQLRRKLRRPAAGLTAIQTC